MRTGASGEAAKLGIAAGTLAGGGGLVIVARGEVAQLGVGVARGEAA